MKRILVLSFAAAAVVLAVVGFQKFGPAHSVSAQKAGRSVSTVKNVSLGDDAKMAEEIEAVTNRSGVGLETKTGPNGVIVDLEGGFQNLMLARVEDDDSSAAACVTSLGEANRFLGRDLRTGERLPRTVVERTDHSSHEMSESEIDFFKKMIADAQAKMALRPESATITIVNNDGVGEGFNDATAPVVPGEGGNPGVTRGAQRLNVFNAAAAVWSSFLDSSIETSVNAQFNGQTCTPSSATLGSAGAAWVNRDFPGAIVPGTWYHGALANKLSNFDASSYEINATFNSNLDLGCFSGSSRFYYGLDGNNPGGTTNLFVVVLHELGHGLGFSSFADGSTGTLFNGFPDIYTRFMFDETIVPGGLYWHQMSDGQRQASALNDGNVYWDGPNVRIASSFLTSGRDAGTGRVRLYTPASFSPGSSVSHFSTAASPNLLMEPMINPGLAITGDLARQQLRDIGWFRDTTADTTADSITGVTVSGGAAAVGAVRTVSWTNNGGFNRNVHIELSTDGGTTFPTVVASNLVNTGSYAWTVPNTPTTTARLRVREVDFAAPSGVSSANFSISSGPLAGNATVSGRVLDQAGRAVFRATVVLTDENGVARSAVTNQFGYFALADVPVGHAYAAAVRHKRHRFAPQLVSLTDSFADLNFVAVP